jgi:hypothetical protein
VIFSLNDPQIVDSYAASVNPTGEGYRNQVAARRPNHDGCFPPRPRPLPPADKAARRARANGLRDQARVHSMHGLFLVRFRRLRVTRRKPLPCRTETSLSDDTGRQAEQSGA